MNEALMVGTFFLLLYLLLPTKVMSAVQTEHKEKEFTFSIKTFKETRFDCSHNTI